MIKKALAVSIVAATCILSVAQTGCGKSGSDSVSKNTDAILNYTKPEEGEEIVTISVKDYGDIKIKLFDDLMPDACENFKTHAKDGYYDELIFHRVINDFMIQGGDPTGSGTGGETIDSLKGKDFGTSKNLIHVVGAVAYANSGSTSTNGSQFYIVTGAQPDEMTDDYFSYIEQAKGTKISNDAKKLYKQYGGQPYLDGDYTVFGQVIDGLDVAYKIAAITDKDASDKPYKDVVMEKVTVEKYDGSTVRFYKSDYSDIDESVEETS